MRTLLITLLLTLGWLPPVQASKDLAENQQKTRAPKTNARLDGLLHKIADRVQKLRDGFWVVVVGRHRLLVITDQGNNRMRIMVPVRDSKKIPAKTLHRMMQANFDSTLDARYAIAQNKLWSVYIHPLAPLTPGELLSGIIQVINLHDSYGKTYSSGMLTFRGGDSGALNRELYLKLKKRLQSI